jgi:hypothetical protein
VGFTLPNPPYGSSIRKPTSPRAGAALAISAVSATAARHPERKTPAKQSLIIHKRTDSLLGVALVCQKRHITDIQVADPHVFPKMADQKICPSKRQRRKGSAVPFGKIKLSGPQPVETGSCGDVVIHAGTGAGKDVETRYVSGSISAMSNPVARELAVEGFSAIPNPTVS